MIGRTTDDFINEMKPATEKTLQSIDATLKRIAYILDREKVTLPLSPMLSGNKRVDKQFDEIWLRDIRLKIAEAFLYLEVEMRMTEYGTKDLSELEIEVALKKANRMKTELNAFIDSQVAGIINESNSQLHSASQETE